MNLKRGFLALAAMILGVGFLGAFPQQAHATSVTLGGVTCTLANDSNSAFPNNQFWNCSSTGNANSMRAVLRGIGTDAASKLKNGTGSNGQFYLFENYHDYFSFCGGGTVLGCAAAVNGSLLGYTQPGSPTYSVVFSTFEISPGVFAFNPKFDSSVAHETGHQLDPLYGPVLSSSAASNSSLYNTKLTKDWTNFNATTPCNPAGFFRAQKDTFGNYICASTEAATVGGTIHAGDLVTITVTDSTLSPNPQSVTVTVSNPDTLTAVAQKLATAINQNANLLSHGFSASNSGATLNIVSQSGKTSSYSRTVTGSITLSLGSPGNGLSSSFSSAYVGKANNEAVLKAAWPQTFPDNSEIWAEEIAADKTGTAPGNQNQSVYFLNNGFACTLSIAHSLRLTGNPPTSWITPCQ